MIENIESFLVNNFQNHIEILIDNRPIKKGKFILYRISSATNYFHIELFIERPTNHKKIDIIKIPIPFQYEEYPDEKLLYMDYRLASMFKNKQNINEFNAIASGIKTEPLKFFNKIAVIQFS